MKVYVDSENKIRAVGTTTDTSLTEVFIDETADTFPFKGWSIAKICCYMVNVSDGVVTMMTPYVDSRSLEMIDNMGHQIDATSDNTNITTETVDGIMTDMLPELAEADENIIATIDSILTDIIPSIVGE
jgi:hypothetical protein